MDNQRDNLLYIAEYYGMDNQLEYLMSELRELIEAVTVYELNKTKANQEHVGEEITDNKVLLSQIFVKYDLKMGQEKKYETIENIPEFLDKYCRTIYKLYKEIIEYWSDEYYYYEPVEEQHKDRISKYWTEAMDMLLNLEVFYDIPSEFMHRMFDFKVNRQIERIRKEEEENE